jgi:hypothetical protein
VIDGIKGSTPNSSYRDLKCSCSIRKKKKKEKTLLAFEKYAIIIKNRRFLQNTAWLL